MMVYGNSGLVQTSPEQSRILNFSGLMWIHLWGRGWQTMIIVGISIVVMLTTMAKDVYVENLRNSFAMMRFQPIQPQ